MIKTGVEKASQILVGSMVDFEVSGDVGEHFGVAVDVGTTTVAASLVCLDSGRVLGNAATLNPQKAYGQDVLARISFVMENEDGLIKLQESIIECLNALVEQLCKETNVSFKHIYNFAISANPTMMHVLLGVDPTPIGLASYTPVFTKWQDVPASQIGLKATDECRVYCLPGVSAYVGADVVAGIYASKLTEEMGNAMFIDIGTNGEIVLSLNGQLFACSCAAGPALEGANISCGMRAAPGAIEDIKFMNNNFVLKTINNKPPIGICGSGIMAAAPALLQGGFMKAGGALLKEKDFKEGDPRLKYLWQEGRARGVHITDDIIITQQDIRQIQLAKGAILSGFYALLQESGISIDDLDKVIIAGQFGAHLPPQTLIEAGLLPMGLMDKISYVGNSSHTGAYLALTSKEARQQMERLAPNINFKELSTMPNYEKLFVKCLNFNQLEERNEQS